MWLALSKPAIQKDVNGESVDGDRDAVTGAQGFGVRGKPRASRRASQRIVTLRREYETRP